MNKKKYFSGSIFTSFLKYYKHLWENQGESSEHQEEMQQEEMWQSQDQYCQTESLCIISPRHKHYNTRDHGRDDQE